MGCLDDNPIAGPAMSRRGSITYLDDQKKSFWLLFTLLSLGAFFLPLAWGVAETFAALFVSWWVIYRSGIF